MATLIVSYLQSGQIRLRHDLEIQFNRGTARSDTLKLDVTVCVDRKEDLQAAEDFYFPIFLKEAADTIRRHFGATGQQVSVVDRQLRPGLEGRAEFLGLTRDEFKAQLGDFRQRVSHALARLG